jgi:hypothetical protein
MKSPLKIIIVMAGVAIVSASVIVLVHQSRPAHKTLVSPPTAPEIGLPTALSNYSKTFKLNTNPPVWPTAAHERNTTN